MRRFGLVIIMIFCLDGIATAQTETFAIKDIDSLMIIKKKPILILLSTDWCKYCQIQKNQLKKNKNFLNQADNFYYVIFNAESKDPVMFHKQLFQYKANGLSSGIHELAIALNGVEKVAFPTLVLLDTNYQVLFRNNGILSSRQLKEILDALDLISIK